MNDFRLVRNIDGSRFTPQDIVTLHNDFVKKLVSWFEKDLSGSRVVISHHVPTINPNTQYKNSPLMPAFNSLYMIEIIEKHQPALWVYGHTHECDDQTIGKTRIISNQLGYPNQMGGLLSISQSGWYYDPKGPNLLTLKLMRLIDEPFFCPHPIMVLAKWFDICAELAIALADTAFGA